MELALEFGMPVGMMSRVMSEAELEQWARYASRRLLPTKRIEILLAQVSRFIAMTMGGATDASIADFMIQPRIEEPEVVVTDEDLAEMKEFFGFSPRPRRVSNG